MDQYNVKGATRVFWRDLILRCVLIAVAMFFVGASVGAIVLLVRG